MNDKKNKSGLVSSSSAPTEVNLSPTNSLDLSFLPEEERKELLASYAKGMLDLSLKAQELNVDASALRRQMDDSMAIVKDADANAGEAATVSYSVDNAAGRTEILIGNTEHAQKGRLTKSQTGEKDWTPFYIFGGIIALILIVALNN